MNPKQLWPFLFILGIAALVIAGLVATARAQSGPGTTFSTAVQTGPGFTFQGQLQDNGTPVNGSCDVRAGLWDAASGGAQIGGTQTVSGMAVVDGRFTITLNANEEFGTVAFNGQARWLEIAVRCPAGSGSYTTLQPRRPLTAAPYAHGLVPGARTETDYVGLWGTQIAMSSDQAHGGIYTQMGDVINSGQQAGIRSDVTLPGFYAILGQSNQASEAAIWGRNISGGSGGEGVIGTSISGTGVRGTSFGDGTGVIGRSTDGVGLYGKTDTFIAVYGYGISGMAAYFYGDVTIGFGVCSGCTQAVFGVNNGRFPLQQGDLVTIENVTAAEYGNAQLLWQVRKAQQGDPIVGVVHGTVQTRTDPEMEQQILVPGENSVAPGDMLSIIIFGPAPVRLETQAKTIQAGERLTAGGSGLARSLQTVEVNGVTLSESAPTLGIALEAGDSDGDGLVWVLVNPN